MSKFSLQKLLHLAVRLSPCLQLSVDWTCSCRCQAPVQAPSWSSLQLPENEESLVSFLRGLSWVNQDADTEGFMLTKPLRLTPPLQILTGFKKDVVVSWRCETILRAWHGSILPGASNRMSITWKIHRTSVSNLKPEFFRYNKDAQ
jgi:hypothetical protein